MIKGPKSNPIESDNEARITLRGTDNVFRESTVRVERSHFHVNYDPRNTAQYLIIGFDTEFKTPDGPVSSDDIKAGTAKYRVLSYQVHCSLHDWSQPEATEWSGICYPNDGERLSLTDVLIFAFSRGIASGAATQFPSKIYIVGHFTRADVPAFADFQTLSHLISSVRSTFLSIDGHIDVSLNFPGGPQIKLGVILRDTILLTPATSKSLAALGELVGQEKIVLDPNPVVEQHYKENMDLLLKDDPGLFERYAINDSVICVKYLKTLISQYEELMGVPKVPATLSSIGVDLLLKAWKTGGISKYSALGKEITKETYFSKLKNRKVSITKDVDMEEVAWHSPFVTECYHGGRNEQFWFGPAFEDDWTDHDLAGAYPTAMALIGMPDWRSAYVSYKVSDYTATTLGYATVVFEFPKNVRFPTLPVRSDNGLIFPRKGVSNCAAPEVALAKALGAKLTIRHGVIIPSDPGKRVFGDFIRDCIQQRTTYPKGSLRNLFWKELSNSTYGKTAQGLRMKRVFDSRDREMKPLPPSKITNPFFAAFITSFVRAALGEVMNGLPEHVCIFSCTTDGFLTNATEEQIAKASNGPIADLYRQSRHWLTNAHEMLEIKHQIRRPLGWRTRGQATLIEGATPKGDDTNIVLAKGGIYTTISMDDVRSRNNFIVNLFLERTPSTRIEVRGTTGIRDIVESDADLVATITDKRLSMEYDWKRRPSAAWNELTGIDHAPSHLAFSTVPWETIDEFLEMRRYWDEYGFKPPRCLKTVEDFHGLALSVLAQSSLGKEGARYLHKTEPDIRRLRQSLCAAWRGSKAGLQRKVTGKTAEGFAALLISVGIPCKGSDVENARGGFKSKNCPSTPAVLAALARLQEVFPSLEIDGFMTTGEGIDLLQALHRPSPFIAQAGKVDEDLLAAE